MTSTGPRGGVPHSSARSLPDDEPNLVDALRALRALYHSLPTLHCKGLCAESCETSINMSMAERGRIERYVGGQIPPMMWQTKGFPCPLLTPDGQHCSVYRIRPMICRLWGMTENPKFRCPHGCEPDRWLTDVDVIRLLLDSFEAGVSPYEGEFIPNMREVLAAPDMAPVVTRWISGEATFGELHDVVDRLRRHQDSQQHTDDSDSSD